MSENLINQCKYNLLILKFGTKKTFIEYYLASNETFFIFSSLSQFTDSSQPSLLLAQICKLGFLNGRFYFSLKFKFWGFFQLESLSDLINYPFNFA